MAITTGTTESTPTTGIVAVRIPRGSDAGLATDAERRLTAIEGVHEISIGDLRDLEPQLSATVVTVEVSIDSTVPIAELRDRFAASTSIDAIERLDGR
jgi:hypothetical protein